VVYELELLDFQPAGAGQPVPGAPIPN
jgi:hypothetical protein